MTRPVLILLLVAALAAPTAQAQPRAEPAQVCWRGRPLPRCRAFAIFEMGWHPVLASSTVTDPQAGRPGAGTPEIRQFSNQVLWEVGGMVNRSPLSALGATGVVGTGGHGATFGVKGRYRRWLGATAAVDVGAGILSQTVQAVGPERPGFPGGPFIEAERAIGLTGDVTFNVADLVGVSLRTDVAFAGERPATAVYTGIRGGSWTAVGGTVIAAAWLVALIAIVSSTDY